MNNYKINATDQNILINQYTILYFLRILINDNLGEIELPKELINKLCYIIVNEINLPLCVKNKNNNLNNIKQMSFII